MLKKTIFGVIALSGVAGFNLSAAPTAGESCMAIGGLGMANFVPQNDGTITIVAPLSGSVASASGKITAQRETESGMEMVMEHYFMTEEGGFMHTKDLAVLSKVAGKKDRYMIEITYHVQEQSSSGPLKGYQGSFQSFGTVDLENLKGLIRYSGEICK